MRHHGYLPWILSAFGAPSTEHTRTKAGSKMPQQLPMPDAHSKGHPIPHDPLYYIMVGSA